MRRRVALCCRTPFPVSYSDPTGVLTLLTTSTGSGGGTPYVDDINLTTGTQAGTTITLNGLPSN